jgi:hypothetical protein
MRDNMTVHRGLAAGDGTPSCCVDLMVAQASHVAHWYYSRIHNVDNTQTHHSDRARNISAILTVLRLQGLSMERGALRVQMYENV